MKILCLILLFLLVACTPVSDDPKVTSLSTPSDTLFFNVQNGEVYSSDSIQLDFFQLDVEVSKTGDYVVMADGVSIDTNLTDGAHSIFFPIDSLELLSAVHSSVSNTFSELTLVTELDTFDVSKFGITNLSTSYDYLVVDAENGVVTTSEFAVLDSFTLSITVGEKNDYEITVDTIVSTLNLLPGTHLLKYGWNELALVDTVWFRAKPINSSIQVVSGTVPLLSKSHFNDPYLKYAWHLQVSEPSFVEQWDIDNSSHINVEKVWKSSTGSGIKVAIIDNDFEVDHEDLQGNVIDVYNAVTDNKFLVPATGASHGTTVAGAVAATADNGIGISGVAPNAQLILIQLENDLSTDANTIRAFNYAREQGAQVINCSWGSYGVSDAVSAIVKEMYDAGITVVFATGNSGRGLDYDERVNDESELPWVIGVGVSTEENDYWTSSDYSENLEVIAPGAGSPGFLGLDNMGIDGTNKQYGVVNNNYGYVEGASFSAPTVAGVVALLLEANPLLTPEQIRTILVETADKVGGSDASYVNGFDERRFNGKLNAYEAYKRVL